MSQTSRHQDGRRKDDDHDLLTFDEAQARLIEEASREEAVLAALRTKGRPGPEVEQSQRRLAALRQASQTVSENAAGEGDSQPFLAYQTRRRAGQ